MFRGAWYSTIDTLELGARQSTEFVIARYRDPKANLRTQFLRIIRRAGLKPWPRLFHHLRANRQTELTARFPLHVVCEWIGNSASIADKHYLQVTDAHYDDASWLTTCEVSGAECGCTGGAKCSATSGRSESQSVGKANKKARQNRAQMPIESNRSVTLPNGAIGYLVPPRGRELIANTPRISRESRPR